MLPQHYLFNRDYFDIGPGSSERAEYERAFGALSPTQRADGTRIALKCRSRRSSRRSLIRALIRLWRKSCDITRHRARRWNRRFGRPRGAQKQSAFHRKMAAEEIVEDAGLEEDIGLTSMQSRVVVGADVLDIMSVAMYAEPLVIFRELIQNAADAIDAAFAAGHLASDGGRVDIAFDPGTRTVSVADNGIGLANDAFEAQMLSFGASAKRTGA